MSNEWSGLTRRQRRPEARGALWRIHRRCGCCRGGHRSVWVCRPSESQAPHVSCSSHRTCIEFESTADYRAGNLRLATAFCILLYRIQHSKYYWDPTSNISKQHGPS
eukprot:scaffold200691_cov33-Tisochrysis_lutea.AAC.2